MSNFEFGRKPNAYYLGVSPDITYDDLDAYVREHKLAAFRIANEMRRCIAALESYVDDVEDMAQRMFATKDEVKEFDTYMADGDQFQIEHLQAIHALSIFDGTLTNRGTFLKNKLSGSFNAIRKEQTE